MVKNALKESFKDQSNYHQQEMQAINEKIQKLEQKIKQMYSDKLDGTIDTELWTEFKKQWETDLHLLKMDLKKHELANVNYMDFGVKILDVCRVANREWRDLDPQTISDVIRKTTREVTLDNGKIKVHFAPPFDIVQTLKKRLKSASLKSSACTEWWKLTYDLKTYILENAA